MSFSTVFIIMKKCGEFYAAVQCCCFCFCCCVCGFGVWGGGGSLRICDKIRGQTFHQGIDILKLDLCGDGQLSNGVLFSAYLPFLNCLIAMKQSDKVTRSRIMEIALFTN